MTRVRSIYKMKTSSEYDINMIKYTMASVKRLHVVLVLCLLHVTHGSKDLKSVPKSLPTLGSKTGAQRQAELPRFTYRIQALVAVSSHSFVHNIPFDVRMIYNAFSGWTYENLSHVKHVCHIEHYTKGLVDFFRVQYEYAQFGKPVFVWLSFEIERFSNGRHLPEATSLISKSGAFYANTEGIVNACTKKLVSSLGFHIKTFMAQYGH